MLTLQLYGYWLFEKLYLTYERVFHPSNNVFCTLSIHFLFFFWISDKTLLLMCDISLQSIWISNETLPLVFLLSDAIPGKTLFLVFDIVFLRVWISDETLSSWCLDTRRGYRITFWIFQERERMSYMKVSSILFFLTVWVCLVASLVCLLHSCFSWPPLDSNTANKVTRKKTSTVQLTHSRCVICPIRIFISLTYCSYFQSVRPDAGKSL